MSRSAQSSSMRVHTPDGGSSSMIVPATVTREKRSKACIHCRRSKLKCVRLADHAACVRCEKRGEQCTLGGWLYNDEWHESIAHDLHTGLEQLGLLTTLLVSSGLISNNLLPVFDVPPLRSGQFDATGTLTGCGRKRKRSGSAESDGSVRRDTLRQKEPDDTQISTEQGNAISNDATERVHLSPVLDADLLGGFGQPNPREDILRTDATSQSNPIWYIEGQISGYLGSEDPRANVIKKGLVTIEEAQHLFDSFVAGMGDVLLGFDPQSIPYHDGGPAYMSPFLLCVILLLSAERQNHYHHMVDSLRSEIHQLLAESPTDSLIGSMDLETFRPAGESDQRWEPELGIGPEEVVGAALLAMFSHDRIWTPGISRLARRWAGGLIEWSATGDGHTTFGETIGLFPPPRKLTMLDKARVWLTSYVARALADLQSAFPSATMPNPDQYCVQALSDPAHAVGDILLTRHANILRDLNHWYRGWDQAPQGIQERMSIHRDANAKFDKWRMENDQTFVGAQSLSSPSRALLDIEYAFSKSVSHAAFARWVMDDGVVSKVDRRRYRDAMWAGAVDAAMELIDIFSHLQPRHVMRDLPATLYIFLNQSAEIVLEARRSSATFWLHSITTRLNQIVFALMEQPLPPNHYVLSTASTLQAICTALNAPTNAA